LKLPPCCPKILTEPIRNVKIKHVAFIKNYLQEITYDLKINYRKVKKSKKKITVSNAL